MLSTKFGKEHLKFITKDFIKFKRYVIINVITFHLYSVVYIERTNEGFG